VVGSAKRVGAVRGAIVLALTAVLLAVLPLATASSQPGKPGKPKIKTEEAGYFGSGQSTRTVSVLVYTNLGPRAGVRVTVCMQGNTCKKAHGHNAKLAWYRADFNTRQMTMSDRVTFTAIASNAAGATKVTATKPVLCIRNDGSTPQS
jgi:hypothetical protein